MSFHADVDGIAPTRPDAPVQYENEVNLTRARKRKDVRPFVAEGPATYCQR